MPKTWYHIQVINHISDTDFYEEKEINYSDILNDLKFNH